MPIDPKQRGSRMLDNLTPLFETPEEKAALEILRKKEAIVAKLGEDGLRQDEFSRAMAEAQSEKGRSQKWYDELNVYNNTIKAKEAALDAKLAALDSTPGAPAAGATTPDLSSYIKRSDVEQLLSERLATERAAAGAVAVNTAAYMAELQLKHYKEFGEVLPQGDLLQHCRSTNQNIDQGGYESYIREKRAVVSAAVQEKALKDAEARGFDRARQEMSAPYSLGVGGHSVEEGTLSGLGKPKDSQKSDAVAAAVGTYNTLLAAKKSA